MPELYDPYKSEAFLKKLHFGELKKEDIHVSVKNLIAYDNPAVADFMVEQNRTLEKSFHQKGVWYEGLFNTTSARDALEDSVIVGYGVITGGGPPNGEFNTQGFQKAANQLRTLGFKYLIKSIGLANLMNKTFPEGLTQATVFSPAMGLDVLVANGFIPRFTYDHDTHIPFDDVDSVPASVHFYEQVFLLSYASLFGVSWESGNRG